jgi:hypothetical protein
MSMRLAQKARRVGGACGDGEFSVGEIERNINGRSTLVVGKSELRVVLMVLWSLLWV